MITHVERVQIIYGSSFNDMKIDYKVIGENIEGVFPGTWFIYEVDPVPGIEELKLVASDIVDGISNINHGTDGKIYHAGNCTKQEHELSVDLEIAIQKLKPEKFKIAIWLGNEIHSVPEEYNNQPIALVLSGEMSHYTYPEHRYLNESFESEKYFMPESICYQFFNKNFMPDENIVKRVENCMNWISDWLLKYQLWVIMKEYTNSAWIGKQVENMYFITEESKERLNLNKKRHKKILKAIRKKLLEN